jgi:hypothetical protein
MLLLATLLSFGWPVEKTQWLPHGSPVPTGTRVLSVPMCCGSMRPTFRGGETVYAIRPDGRKFPGYVVFTKRLMHRVTAESRDAVLTSGDANKRSDTWTPKSEIEWIVLYAERP